MQKDMEVLSNSWANMADQELEDNSRDTNKNCQPFELMSKRKTKNKNHT